MYYKHSGQFSLAGLMVGGLIGLAGALILAYVYGRGSILIPDARLAAFATIAFGGLMGVGTGYGLVWGKVRNQTASLAVQAVVSAIGLYVSWAVWVVDIFKRGQSDGHTWMEFAANPAALWRAICFINQYGTWGLEKGDSTKGTELWCFWLAEAATVICLAVCVGYEVLQRHAFCERCDSWCSREAKILLSSPQNASLLKRQLEAKNWSSLENLTGGSQGTSHLEVVLDSCGQCRHLHTMTLTHTSVTRNKLRQTKMSKKRILQHLLIDPAQAENLRQMSVKVGVAAQITGAKASAASIGTR